MNTAGPQEYDASTHFIEEKFESLNANPSKTIYMHQTCATGTFCAQSPHCAYETIVLDENA